MTRLKQRRPFFETGLVAGKCAEAHGFLGVAVDWQASVGAVESLLEKTGADVEVS